MPSSARRLLRPAVSRWEEAQAAATIANTPPTLLRRRSTLLRDPQQGMKPPDVQLIYEFGDFELDALRRVLTSRVDGQELQVTGRAFDTLLYLVERPGQLLDKRTLMDALWPKVVVEEGNLTQTIYTLRRVLGERPGEHRYIVTVPGRGYRFVADVKVKPTGRRTCACRRCSSRCKPIHAGRRCLPRRRKNEPSHSTLTAGS